MRTHINGIVKLGNVRESWAGRRGNCVHVVSYNLNHNGNTIFLSDANSVLISHIYDMLRNTEVSRIEVVRRPQA